MNKIMKYVLANWICVMLVAWLRMFDQRLSLLTWKDVVSTKNWFGALLGAPVSEIYYNIMAYVFANILYIGIMYMFGFENNKIMISSFIAVVICCIGYGIKSRVWYTWLWPYDACLLLIIYLSVGFLFGWLNKVFDS